MSRNVENVISLEAVGDMLPYRAVKATANGVDYAGAGDIAIGMTLPGDLERGYPTVQLYGRFVEAELGDATDIVRGDAIEQAANGKYVKATNGKIVGVAWTGATEAGDRFEALIFQQPGVTAPVLTSTNGTAAAAGDLAALKTETEKVGDDVRALHAALVTAGVLR